MLHNVLVNFVVLWSVFFVKCSEAVVAVIDYSTDVSLNQGMAVQTSITYMCLGIFPHYLFT